MSEVECEFCAGKLSEDLVCQEGDCGADMQVHWEMTNPDKLSHVLQLQRKTAEIIRPTFGCDEYELAMLAFNT